MDYLKNHFSNILSSIKRFSGLTKSVLHLTITEHHHFTDVPRASSTATSQRLNFDRVRKSPQMSIERAIKCMEMKQYQKLKYISVTIDLKIRVSRMIQGSLNLDDGAQHPAVGISYGSCQSIIQGHGHIKLGKLCGYPVPRHLTVQGKQNRLEICNDLIEKNN
ncbi:hypothetical protein LAZ67_2001775 [Cordylochernes scorpioides]|uniref:Ribosomal protein S3 n=1 Tax=Cordylochernes scorpioides TaxID=51811 RepID=A0ABY6K383_9ARAC|nr:hypothetical protein LAZ67_2001775 [Cordylochernes scorpioides]